MLRRFSLLPYVPILASILQKKSPVPQFIHGTLTSMRSFYKDGLSFSSQTSIQPLLSAPVAVRENSARIDTLLMAFNVAVLGIRSLFVHPGLVRVL